MKLILATLISIAVMGCSGTNTAPAQDAAKSQKQPITENKNNEEQKMITVTGTIRFKTIEGGFFALDGHNGEKYMPHGMDKSLLKDGMVVEVKGIIMKDMMTFQQYGEVLKVTDSKMVDDSNVKPSANEY
ncbi:MAG: hypothetical protein Alis3KO_07430 [Aliiglaciecola sp.]|uniref:hypothetical protein n=1 Tax=Aliiglaciecola sp. M165 TaxID=2593649 RepID=UPI00117D99D9|nr:hypothetical protein [Aliiglaciecola sp. M165]TRY29344.1 hypothetical protein FM019_18250 [Aliiglaciecola sp. M165]